jgi:hypothetical protein
MIGFIAISISNHDPDQSGVMQYILWGYHVSVPMCTQQQPTDRISQFASFFITKSQVFKRLNTKAF